ncbi:hypothetical protein OH491_21190 [Termitidicoccus mucosus]|uniref:Uncharacterized protein n=1 Tax=Termitidicoccus mucosus TaxID=1184151 RepID=A0A178ICT6_9BACT|nr:hypothetical protein AW736_22525 [Opitutaceae bacterium TSB47]
MELSRHQAAADPLQKAGQEADDGKAASRMSIIKKLADTALIRGYDDKDHCIYINLLEKKNDQDWELIEIRHQRYRELGIRKLSVLMLGPNGETWRLPDDIFPS